MAPIGLDRGERDGAGRVDETADEPRRPGRGARRKKAYEEIAAMLLDQIVHGERTNGERLPSETVLASELGVSRATVREALRTLTARDVIRTAKGTRGGSYVQLPSVQQVATSLQTSLNLLSSADQVSVKELLETRELLEVPAARLAATRRAPTHVERLRDTIQTTWPPVDNEVELAHNSDFHAIVLEASGNTLLTIAAQPVFTVLQSGFARTSLGLGFHKAVRDHHHEIAEAIDRGDPDQAGSLMHEHLVYLRPTYERLSRGG
jgi:DNA-binding FadR family transcriptional regulator